MPLPRVLIVGNFLSGQNRTRGVCEDLALHMRQAGWSVVTTSSKPTRAARLADMLFSVWHKRDDYDVAQVDVYSGLAFRWAETVCSLLRKIGRPYVLTLHGGALPQFAAKEKKRVRRLLCSAAAVTVPSEYLRARMIPYRNDLTLLPNALTLSDYQTTRSRALRPRLVWLRSFHDVYNPSMAVRVLAHLKEEFPEVRLSMAGADKQDGSLERAIATARSCNVGDRLELCGLLSKPSVPGFLAQADIFLNTSSVDNTPVSVLEAMASGLCVVSTEVGGIPYLLSSGRDALLVAPNDDVAMAAAVRMLLTNPDLVNRLQVASKAKVRTFDWSTILPQWQNLLMSVAQHKPVAVAS